jgi:hypothetical protein
MTIEKAKQLASLGRDFLALLFTPVVTGVAIWLIAILAYWNWTPSTEAQRINYLGAIAIISIVLVALGGQWFQRNRLAGLKATGLGGSFDLEVAADPAVVEPQPLAAITTTTTTTVPQQPTGQT